jgi:hypothetical protein
MGLCQVTCFVEEGCVTRELLWRCLPVKENVMCSDVIVTSSFKPVADGHALIALQNMSAIQNAETDGESREQG